MRFLKAFSIIWSAFLILGCSSGDPGSNSDNYNETEDNFNVLPDSNTPDENIARQ
jgi:hypothetical protein